MADDADAFSRRRALRSSRQQSNRHGTFTVADLQAIRAHLARADAPSPQATLQWVVRNDFEAVHVLDDTGSLIGSFAVTGGRFSVRGPMTGGRDIGATASLDSLLDRLRNA
jgi:hypothetical protein